MHISNLVYKLPSEMPCVAERPWPLASLYTPDAESALCHVFLLLIKDKTRLCECHTPLWDLPSSHIKESVRWTATADSYTSHPLLCNLRALSSSNKYGRGALWKSVREDEGSRKECRGWFPRAEREKEHTPAQHELSAEASNKGNNQVFLNLLTFLK